MKGEAMKLYNYYQVTGNDGALGAMVTIFVYVGFFLIHAFVLYNYLVFLHMEGRLIDIFTRVTADVDHFFVPIDNEVSARYLRWVIACIVQHNSAVGTIRYGTKHASVTFHTVSSRVPCVPVEHTTHIATYTLSTHSCHRKHVERDGSLKLYRHFVRTEEGAICEISENLPFSVDEHPLLELWPRQQHRPEASCDSAREVLETFSRDYSLESKRRAAEQSERRKAAASKEGSGPEKRFSRTPSPPRNAAEDSSELDNSMSPFEPHILIVKGE